MTQMAVANYESESTVRNVWKAVKKAISKFIDTRLVFFQYPTGMMVDPRQQKIWH